MVRVTPVPVLPLGYRLQRNSNTYHPYHIKMQRKALKQVCYLYLISQGIYADRQLGKVTQWTNEKVFSGEKTQLSSEFTQFERDIEIKKNGIER